MDEKIELIAIKVPPILKRQLEKAAEAEGTTVPGFIQNMLTMALTEMDDFTPLSATKLQKLNYMSMFSQWYLTLENKELNLLMVMALVERLGQKKDAERYNKMLKATGEEIIWIKEALKLMAAGKWTKFYSYVEKGFPG